MPTAYIKQLAAEGHGSIEHLESEWEKAKAEAAKQGKAKNFGYVTQIFKSMIGASHHLDAKTRLRATHRG